MRPSVAALAMFSALVALAAAAQEPDGGTPRPPPTTTAATHTKAARATPRRTSRTTHRTPPRPVDHGDGTSLSIGRHNRGRLLRGHELTESASLRFKTRQEARYGTDELVALLERAGRRVMERTPGAPLTVGNLSNRGGGRFRPHRSHQSGRDADVAYYTTDADGAPLMLDRFYDFRRDLTVRGHDEIHFDVVRSWQVVEALVTDEVPVQWIFVARYIRTRLLEEGARQGASAEVIAHAEEILSQPSHGGGIHNDHLHVRIYCPAGDRPRCVDDPPMHPWLLGIPTVEVMPAD